MRIKVESLTVDQIIQNLYQTSNCVVLSDKPTLEEIKKGSSQLVKSWNTSFDYEVNDYEKFRNPGGTKGKEFDRLMGRDDFKRVTFYVGALFNDLSYNHNLSKYGTKIANEINYFDDEGKTCVYISTVLYHLLTQFTNLDSNKLSYVQGFYKHDLREDFPPVIPIGKLQCGLHAFLVYDESVLDFSVGQLRSHFNFKGQYFIVGDIPSGLDLYGVKEKMSVIEQNTKDILEYSNMNYLDWINMHYNIADMLYEKFRPTQMRLLRIMKGIIGD